MQTRRHIAEVSFISLNYSGPINEQQQGSYLGQLKQRHRHSHVHGIIREVSRRETERIVKKCLGLKQLVLRRRLLSSFLSLHPIQRLI